MEQPGKMYTVIPTERFEKDVKYYVKKKGFVHIGKDIKVITDESEKGNLIGTEIPGLKIPSLMDIPLKCGRSILIQTWVSLMDAA